MSPLPAGLVTGLFVGLIGLVEITHVLSIFYPPVKISMISVKLFDLTEIFSVLNVFAESHINETCTIRPY